jgi:hypothetical protein
MAKVYLATAGEYSGYRVLHAFAHRADAESYKLGDNDVMELEVRDGPVEVRYWYDLDWRADRPDDPNPFGVLPNPYTASELRDFDGNEKYVQHSWSGSLLNVQGWDLALVKKVYSEQRAKYLAQQAGLLPRAERPFPPLASDLHDPELMLLPVRR